MYDPATATFTATSGAMTTSRAYATATLLPNGKVLIAGGEGRSGYLLNAELYDPSTESFTTTSSAMTAARDHAMATLLPIGKVLIAGGYSGGTTYQLSADLYDPSTDSFTTLSGDMTTARRTQRRHYCPAARCLSRGEPMEEVIYRARSCINNCNDQDISGLAPCEIVINKGVGDNW